MAIKLRNLKLNGYRDHIIFECSDRALLFDFMVGYSYDQEDDIIFEQNEEFSMLVNSAPVWFSFNDVERCKKEQDKLFKLNDKDGHSGLVQMKKKNAISFLKSILNKKTWDYKYLVLKGSKLFVYQGQAITKPEEVITLHPDMHFSHVKRSEADGHSKTIQLFNTKDGSPVMIETPSDDSLSKWMKAFKLVRDKLQGIHLRPQPYDSPIKTKRPEEIQNSTMQKSPSIQSTFDFFGNMRRMDGFTSKVEAEEAKAKAANAAKKEKAQLEPMDYKEVIEQLMTEEKKSLNVDMTTPAGESRNTPRLSGI